MVLLRYYCTTVIDSLILSKLPQPLDVDPLITELCYYVGLCQAAEGKA